MLIEEWKEVYPDVLVSTLGRVQRKGEEVKINSFSHNGYPVIYVNKKQKRLATIIANAFIPKVEGKDQVNHIDGNKLNNRIDNLEWCTNKENNSIEKKKNHCSKPIKVKDLTSGQIYKSMCEAARALDVNESTVRSVIYGYRKTAKGHSLILWG